MGTGIEIDMGVDSDMAVSMNLRSFQRSYRAPLKGLGVDIRQASVG